MLVFISHSAADKPFVRRLYGELQRRGLRLWLDEAEIRVGESIPERVGNAIQQADVFCIVLSSASVASHWVSRELNAFVPRMIQRNGVVVPCRLDSCALPPLIADLKYADFSVSFELGLLDFLNAVRIREELDQQAQVAAVRPKINSLLTPDERRRWAQAFSAGGYQPETDESNLVSFSALHDLERLGIVYSSLDSHLILYGLTQLGEWFHKALARELHDG
jgi:TIR domain